MKHFLGFLHYGKLYIIGGCKEAEKGWRGCCVVDGQRRLTVNNVDMYLVVDMKFVKPGL